MPIVLVIPLALGLANVSFVWALLFAECIVVIALWGSVRSGLLYREVQLEGSANAVMRAAETTAFAGVRYGFLSLVVFGTGKLIGLAL